jgi:hypothetical protein
MDLIDANAGGVRFSADARRELLNKPFASAALSHGDVTNLFSGWDSTHVKPIDKSAPRTP